MKIDATAQYLTLSVKELISGIGSQYSSSSPLPRHLRALKGTRLHQAYQSNALKLNESPYIELKNELPINIKKKIDGWNVEITGRADSVQETPEKIIVEEIKSVDNVESFSPKSEIGRNYIHQLQIYATYFANQDISKSIICHLVLIEVESEDTEILDIPYNDQTSFIYGQIRNIISAWEHEQKENQKKKKRVSSIPFPFREYRPHQDNIIAEVSSVLKKENQLLLLAPAGLGKTVGTLYPALIYTIQNNKRLFVVTSKTTQQKIYVDTLQLIIKKGGKFKAAILTAKEKMCINSVFLCERNACPYLRNYSEENVEEVLSQMHNVSIVDSKLMQKLGHKHQLCPFELLLDFSLLCDVIVGDFNYVFDPRVRLRRFFDRDYSDSLVIIDEAHNLPQRAKEYYSPSLSIESIRETRDYMRLQHIPKKLQEEAWVIFQNLEDYLKMLSSGGILVSNPNFNLNGQFGIGTNRNRNRETFQMTALDKLLQNSSAKSKRKKAQTQLTPIAKSKKRIVTKNPHFPKGPYFVDIDKDFIHAQLKAYDEFLFHYSMNFKKTRGKELKQGDLVVIFEKSLRFFSSIMDQTGKPEFTPLFYPETTTLKIFCKSAAKKLTKQMNGFCSVIAQSATLFSLEYFRQMLGMKKSTEKLQFPSPFPPENHLYLTYPNVSTRFNDRNSSYKKIAEAIILGTSCKIGNYLAFFPSFAYLEAVERELEELIPPDFPMHILIQKKNMSEKDRAKYLKCLHSRKNKYLLLGVHGGIFSEGVDYEGEMAIGAFIISPGLPSYCLEQELMKDYYDGKWNKGFEYAYRNPGITRVIQAAGRIFRTPTDRGVIVLIGQRFEQPYYRSILPAEWNLESSKNLVETIQGFWH